MLAVSPVQADHGARLHLTGAERLGTVVVLAVLGLAVAGLGAYGWRQGAALLPRALAAEQVAHRVAVLRRGCVACATAGLVLIAAAVFVAIE